MFGHRFWGARYYGPRYWGDGGSDAVVAPASTGGGGGSILAGRRRRSTSGIWVRLDDEDTRAALRAKAAETQRRHDEAIARQREAAQRQAAEREATEAELATRVSRDAERAAEAERQRLARLRHLKISLGGVRVFVSTGSAEFTTHRVVVAGPPALLAIAGGQASFAWRSVAETLSIENERLKTQVKRLKDETEALSLLLLD